MVKNDIVKKTSNGYDYSVHVNLLLKSQKRVELKNICDLQLTICDLIIAKQWLH